MPKISVIVPVYKVEAFLDRCVCSILGQSFPDFELILVDDGSPDRCGALCDGYAAGDPRIHVIHQENGGLSAARNAGIDYALAHSSSRYLAFVDSDDWIHRDYLKALHQAAEATGCLISACGCFPTQGEALPEGEDTAFRVYSADDYYCGKFHGTATPVAWNKLYARELFARLRYPVGKIHEDEFTTYRCIYQAGQVAAMDARLYGYYSNPEGITRSAWNPRRLHALEGMEGQMAFARETGNRRLLAAAAEGYLYAAADQLTVAAPEYRRLLRKKLGQGLKIGRKCGCFPLDRQHLWAYEMAYPCKPLWWLISKC